MPSRPALPLRPESIDQLNGQVPDWLVASRRQGLGFFEKLDMPSSAEEVWRYVDLPFRLEDLMLAPPPAAGMDDGDDVAGSLGSMAGQATIIDGTVTDLQVNEEGVVFVSLRDGLADHEDALSVLFGSGIAPDLDVFSAAHHAFAHDGVFLKVPANRSVERPFYIDVQATAEGTVSFPHITLAIEANAEASVVVGFRSPAGIFLVVNPQIEAFVNDGARLKLSTVQRFGYDTHSIAHERVLIGRDANARLGEVGLGGRLGRLHLTLDVAGRGASTDLVGLYFGEQEQTLDYRLFMNHLGSNTSSNVFLKGAVEDDARSVFTGLVKIEKDIAKVSAFETNRNLVLSEGASAHSVPNLEILSNDVICGHGSTVGPLEEEPLYYLMSRGLSEARAARLLVHGFFEEVINRLPHPALAAPVREAVNRKFVQAQQEGRV
ncbi:MAG: Fe-S cluster assembly protein SufD [Acidimicrobiia bacterium]|nr:Fe-S cluster assembly protein SufD [Acidimicrobiia bacterium]